MRDHAVEWWRWAVVVLVLDIMKFRVGLESIRDGFLSRGVRPATFGRGAVVLCRGIVG
jgi:hypothetical protein